MHGAGEQQYRYARHDEYQPSTSSPGVSQMLQPPPTTSTSQPRPPESSGASRPPPSLVRIGHPIKIGANILQPAGTLVFSQSDGARIIVHNKASVVPANLFPIGMNLQPSNGQWFINQQSVTTTTSSNGNVNSMPSITSSATPDSGIQSVPTSPPSPRYEMANEQDVDDDDDDPDDFTDMPTLKPADEDDCYDAPSTSAGPSVPETTTTPLPTTPLPPAVALARDALSLSAADLFALAIAENSDLDAFAQRLISFDPDKANEIAVMIKKKCAEELKRKKPMAEAEVSSTTPTTPRVRATRKKTTKVTRSTNSPDVTTSTHLHDEPSTSSAVDDADVEVEIEVKQPPKKRGRKPKKRDNESSERDTAKKSKVEEPSSQTPSTPEPSSSHSSIVETDSVQFRLKVHEMMQRQLVEQTEQMSYDMLELRLGHGSGPKTAGVKRKESFYRQLTESSRKIKKGIFGKRLKMFMTKEEIEAEEAANSKKLEEVKEEEKEKEDGEEEVPAKIRSRLPSRRARTTDSPEVTFAVEEKFNGEYYEIPKSIPASNDVIPLWKAPSLSCGCTKGACTSDIDCLNRAMRVQCGTECTVPVCSNRRFWKEDSSKLCVSNGPKSRRVLKTKVARRAGEFLCEYAGEVIKSEEALSRFEEKPDSRIIAIGSELFVDATTRANVARFIKHSCKPNARLEVWSVSGFYRAGVFALNDLATNCEVTVDKSGLIPIDQPCTCGASNCRKFIKGVRRAKIVAGDEKEHISTRRFLARNRRKTIERARRSGLPAILTMEEPAVPSRRLQMKKVLAAFAFRVRRIDGSMARPMLPYYSTICKFLRISSNPKCAEFVSLFRKWLDAIDDDDLERAFVAIERHYLNSSLLASAQTKKQKEHAPPVRAPPTSCHSPGLNSRRGDADLSYLESLHPIGSYDPDASWETYKANTNDNAVRCICGSLDEDGEMVQCDTCHFWLHIECCSFREDSQDEYKCDFCRGKLAGNRPSSDVKLMSPLDVRFEHCDYYRALMNRRGIQVRLNETVYVSRTLREDHKGMLRNLREQKKGSKTPKPPDMSLFPPAPTDPLPIKNTERKETRIFRVERLFVCPGNNRFVFGSFYAWPHETYADTHRDFHRKEVFATPYYETLPLDEVIGRCLVVDLKTWQQGRPKVPKYKEDDIFFCEIQIGKNQRVFEKVPQKNRYPINTQPYVFTRFSQPKKMNRDFRPYDPSNPSPKPPKTPVPQPSPISDSRGDPLPDVDRKDLARKRIRRVLARLTKKRNVQSAVAPSVIS